MPIMEKVGLPRHNWKERKSRSATRCYKETVSKFFQNYPKICHCIFSSEIAFFNIAQKVAKYLATLLRNYVTKNFPYSPNLITLEEGTSDLPIDEGTASSFSCLACGVENQPKGFDGKDTHAISILLEDFTLYVFTTGWRH